ncbi:DASH complex subunit Dad2-domain-containing protein [Halteromyces radiatus]|uniref:DASH complex subunit Dad2-domain-containing protein n=1 Tax=Halteromyces radiatus TaxID=101107 RepID=UPI002220B6E2|nr:DASH complex subunit Dad2-domain-containing protein [Halteromyces radiatus]KAI8097139.1 DASH complex subunit Dad2-domain-containing protein [Halteromyces radiatus]
MNEEMNSRQRTTHTTKLETLREKKAELEELTRIKDLSTQLVSHFESLAKNVQELSNGARGVATVLSNWDPVFRTMGLMNTETRPNPKNPTIVNLPIASDRSQ